MVLTEKWRPKGGWLRKPLKNMEPMSGLEPPFGLRITKANTDEEESG